MVRRLIRILREPWREVARTIFSVVPASRWCGPSRLIGLPLAWLLTAIAVGVMAFTLGAISLALLPLTFYRRVRTSVGPR